MRQRSHRQTAQDVASLGLHPKQLQTQTAALHRLERGIEQHVKLVDKSYRPDGTFSRSDFVSDTEWDLYECPAASSCENIAATSPSRATAF